MTRGRVRRAGRAAGAAAALAALTGGLPAVLYAAGGSPLPHRVPSWRQVAAAAARPEDAAVVLAAVRAVSWLAWAMFTLSVVIEIIALWRGRPARRLAMIGPLQGLAAFLISAAITATAVPASAQPATARLAAASHPHPPPRARLAGARPAAYRVRPGDNLWNIAARYLGAGEAWHQIWALNQGRPQPGGGQLTIPSLIQPGWVLRLPPPAAHRPAPPPRHRRPGPPAPHPPGPCPARPGPGSSPPPRPHQPGGPGIALPSGGLAGPALAAAAATALTLAAVHRRRRYRPGGALAGRGDPPVPPLSRSLATLRRAARPAPGGGPSGRAGPDPVPAAPARTAADPAPPAWPAATRLPGAWHEAATWGDGAGGEDDDLYGPPADASPAGTAWPGTARPAWPGGPPGASGPGLPGEVAVGVRDGREISAGLAAVGGLGLTGPGAPGAARALLAALLSRALPGSPHGSAEVIMPAADAALLLPGYHPPAGGRAVLPGLILAPSLDAALAGCEELIIRRARQAGDRHGAGAAGSMPPAVLLATPVRPASARLAAVMAAGRSAGLAVIVLGDWPAGTSCHVTADGIASSADPRLDGTRLYSLSTADAAAVIAVLADACSPPPEPPAPQPGPPSAAPVPEPAAARPGPVPASGPPAPPARPAAPALPDPAAPDRPRPILRVEVLGPLRITARGAEITGGLRKARELAAYLAIHPGGATPEAITEALWPDTGDGAAQRALALRKLRGLLRHAAEVTEPKMVLLSAGRYRLDPTLISTDWADFHAALDDARAAGDDRAQLAACRRAAALYRGPLAEGAGFDWAEPAAETARRRVLDAWTAIAEILQPADPARALAALESALGHDPWNEYLYQKIMRLQAAAGHPEAVRRTLSLLEARLAELGITPGTQTRHIAASLLGTRAPPSSPPPRDHRPPAGG